jgi:hypothetical protein
MLKTGTSPDYPVLHSRFFDRADTATRKLNDYFADTGAESIELRDDLSEIIFPLAPLAVIPIALTALALRRPTGSIQP